MILSVPGAAALARIARASGVRAHPDMLMNADIVLELSGEAIRARLCTFEDASGRELCLRPDLTTAIAQMVASGELPVARYHEAGPVFRLPPAGSDDAVEHLQIGFEWFGNGRSPAEDAEALSVAMEAAQAGGLRLGRLRFGDVFLFHAMLNALPLSDLWRDRLRRGFFRVKGPRELLAYAGERSAGARGAAVEIGLLSSTDAEQAVRDELASLGVEPVGRSLSDIASRLREKAADTVPDPASADAILSYLSLRASVADSPSVLRSFASRSGLNMTEAIAAFEARLEMIARFNPPFWSDAEFGAEVGRRFEYYDGFVFELMAIHTPDRPVVSGGRYDGLIARLSGARQSASAIGAAVRADRLLA